MENSISEQEENLNKLFKNNLLVNPSNNFTKNVMDNISFQTQSSILDYKPIISKNMWWVIVSISIVLIFIVLSQASLSFDFNNTTSNYTIISSFTSNITKSITNFSYKYILILLPAFLLFTVDKYISTSKTLNSYY